MAKDRHIRGELNTKHLRFVEVYMQQLDGIQAVKESGFLTKNHAVAASKLLTDPKIQAEIARRGREIAKKNDIPREKIIKELAKIAFTTEKDFFDENGNLLPIKDLPDGAAAALQEVEVQQLFAGKVQIGITKRYKKWDKIRAMELMAKMLGYMAPVKSQVGFDETFMSFLRKTSALPAPAEDIEFEEQQPQPPGEQESNP